MTMMTTVLRCSWPRAVAFALVAVLLLVALAACRQAGAAGIPTASDNPPTPPAGATPTPPPMDEYDMALAYAQCIRENGLPEWPDPNAQGQFMVTREMGSMNDPRRIAAMEACQHLRPPGLGGGGAMAGPGGPGMGAPGDEEQAFAFARCMRENGVPEFPDPAPAGGGRIVIGPDQGQGGGLDPSSPRFQAAMETCRAQVLGGR